MRHMASIRTILLVEDDPPLRELYRLFLTGKGYTVDQAVDGEEALDRARKTHHDLILLDVMIPKKDGFTVLRELNNDPTFKNAHTKVIVLTNLGHDHLPADLRDKIDAYIVKAEIELEDLITTMKSLEH